MRRCLIVANQTLGSNELAEHLRSLAAAHPELVADVVVPEPMPTYVAGDPMIGVLSPATEAEAYEEARSAAVARLQALVAWLRSIGVTASGSVGPSDPLLAIASAERLGNYDDLVIATLPASASRWLRMDLPHRARRRFGDRVTVIVTAEAGGPAIDGDVTPPVRLLLLGGGTDDPVGPRAALARSSVRTDVTDALTAGEAVDRLGATPAVDLVVLALPCPQLAVDVLVAALRATPAPRPPVAVVSPTEDEAMRDRAHELGAAAVIVAGPTAADTARALDSVLLELVSLGVVRRARDTVHATDVGRAYGSRRGDDEGGGYGRPRRGNDTDGGPARPRGRLAARGPVQLGRVGRVAGRARRGAGGLARARVPRRARLPGPRDRRLLRRRPGPLRRQGGVHVRTGHGARSLPPPSRRGRRGGRARRPRDRGAVDDVVPARLDHAPVHRAAAAGPARPCGGDRRHRRERRAAHRRRRAPPPAQRPAPGADRLVRRPRAAAGRLGQDDRLHHRVGHDPVHARGRVLAPARRGRAPQGCRAGAPAGGRRRHLLLRRRHPRRQHLARCAGRARADPARRHAGAARAPHRSPRHPRPGALPGVGVGRRLRRGAWRVARGTADRDLDPTQWPTGIVGSPDSYDRLPPEAFDAFAADETPSLFRHLQQRREFLRTGRGGLSGSLVVAFAFLLVHLGLLAGLVTAVAWPVGGLARTWFVFGTQRSAVSKAGVQLTVGWRLFGPPIVFAVAAVALWLPTFAVWNTPMRIALRRTALGLFGAAAALALLLVGIPLWIDAAYPWITAHAQLSAIAGLVSGGGAAATVVGLMRKVLGPKLARLGGVLLGVAVILYGTVIASMAVLGHGLFGTGLFGHGWVGWGVLCGALAVGYFFLCPRWWSLHTLYRNRLRGAFVTTRLRNQAPRRFAHVNPGPNGAPVLPMRQNVEPQLHAFASAAGPTHLVCCSAARNRRTSTGVKALSFVLSAHEAVFYDVDPEDARRVSLGSDPLPVQAFAVPVEPWIQALGSHFASQAEGTVSAAISVSGAAFAPAMGRMDMGTTNALLAALNLRLGSWFPNPRYVPEHVPAGTARVRYPWVRISYVLKELFGMYDLVDHHLYVTDGGHRENLGLVELLRRRCAVMICIDASGDTPGSYSTLRQAADLARLEVGARIDLRPLRTRATEFVPGPKATGAWTVAGDVLVNPPRMIVDGLQRPAVAHTVLPVEYVDPQGHHEGAGVIVHLAPLLFDGLDDELVAYALQDPLFPHYSTGNQFLTEEQYRRLAQFGQCAMKMALNDERVTEALRQATSPDGTDHAETTTTPVAGAKTGA